MVTLCTDIVDRHDLLKFFTFFPDMTDCLRRAGGKNHCTIVNSNSRLFAREHSNREKRVKFDRGFTVRFQGGRQGSREPKTAQCGAVLLNANVWDLRLFSVRFFAAGPKVDPRVKCIMS